MFLTCACSAFFTMRCAAQLLLLRLLPLLHPAQPATQHTVSQAAARDVSVVTNHRALELLDQLATSSSGRWSAVCTGSSRWWACAASEASSLYAPHAAAAT